MYLFICHLNVNLLIRIENRKWALAGFFSIIMTINCPLHNDCINRMYKKALNNNLVLKKYCYIYKTGCTFTMKKLTVLAG